MRSLIGGHQFSSDGGQSPPTTIDHVTKETVACPVRACVIQECRVNVRARVMRRL